MNTQEGNPMKLSIDARKLACPMPVIKTKKALEQENVTALEIVVDNPAARENVSHFAGNAGCVVESVVETDGDFTITIVRENKENERLESPAEKISGKVLFVGTDVIGKGNDELGAKLMKAFCYALTEISVPPRKLVFMNGGVKLCVDGSATLENLQTLASRGVEMLVCGTCLDFFGLSAALKVGTVSNMYDIAESLLCPDAVVTI